MDRDRYLEVAATSANITTYLIRFQDKTSIRLVLLVLKNVQK